MIDDTISEPKVALSLDFNNTEVAFSTISNWQLTRRFLIFKAMNNRTLTRFGTSFLSLAFQWRLPVKGIVKSTIFNQFCGGETIEECQSVINGLGNSNIGSILDYSVEGEDDEEAFENVTQKTIFTIQLAKSDQRVPFAVFKMTGIAHSDLLEKVSASKILNQDELKDWLKVKSRLNRIFSTALEYDVPVMVDAEESWIQPAIDTLVDEMMEKYNRRKPIIYNTIQCYRKDRLQFLKSALTKAEKGDYYLGVKLVRGAYMEKERRRSEEMNYPSPIQESKEDTDRDFNSALEYCILNIHKIALCAGTHNEVSSLHLAKFIIERGIKPNNKNIYFSQLYGMGDHISFNLSKAGFNVAKYLPYGAVKLVLPYLFRRAEENSAVSGYASRELRLLIQEQKRRSNLR